MKKRFLNYMGMGMIAFSMIACGGQENNNGEVANGGEKPPMEEAEKEPEEPTEPNAVCLWPEAISIREEASSKAKFITSMYLGEKIFYLGDDKTVEEGKRERTYCRVRLQDGKEGWTRKDFVAEGKAVAILEDATIYKRPDLLTKTSNKFEPMDVVAILEEKEGFFRVKGKKGTWFKEGWIKMDNVTDEQVDVVFAVFYSKAQIMSDEKKEKELKSLVDNSDLAGSVFMSTLQEKMIEMEEPMPEEMPMDEEMSEDGGGADEE